jgi:hypothetical protein
MPNELDDSELRGPRNEGPLLTLMRVPVVKFGTRQKWKLRLPVRNILTRKRYGWGRRRARYQSSLGSRIRSNIELAYSSRSLVHLS